MNTELPAFMATCVVCEAGSRGQKSSLDLASAVSVILQQAFSLGGSHHLKLTGFCWDFRMPSGMCPRHRTLSLYRLEGQS